MYIRQHLSLGFFLVAVSSFLCIKADYIQDISCLTTGHVGAIYAPKTEEQLYHLVKTATCPIALAGGRFSQGGHIWCQHGVVIDMKYLNKICELDLKEKTITVQAGTSWRQIQEHIDPYNLSISVMQSYNDFTIGGSLSVNIHGRTLYDGPLISTIRSIQLLLADGSVVTASRDENYQLFRAAIGGYGACGIITRATIALIDNERLEKQEVIMPLAQYPDYFKNMIKDNEHVRLHNANLHTDSFTTISSITFSKTDKMCTLADRLKCKSPLTIEYLGFQCSRYIPAIQKIRLPLQVIKNTEEVVWRNWEMSTSVATIEPVTRRFSTAVLQEYFVPTDRLLPFLEKLKEVVKTYNVTMMNISLRYIQQDTESIMAYAQSKESFAVVCYINMINSNASLNKARQWTQELIEYVLQYGGTYYLPYQLHATKSQFNRAYPHYAQLLTIKNSVDPQHRFMNSFLQNYIK